MDYREKAPLAARRDMYLDENGEPIKNLSIRGHLAAGVPGTVDGMVKVHQKYGSLSWESLIQPSINLAATGFPLTRNEATGLNRSQEVFQTYNTITPDFFMSKWKEGDSLKLKDLALTLERIRDEGRDGFYSGKTADDIVAEMERGNGIITHQDLKDYESLWRQPITGSYRGHRVISMPPPSSGGIALVQLLTMIETQPMQEWGANDPKRFHVMLEAERRVYADRATHLGDADFYDVPQSGLLTPTYNLQRFESFDPQKATPSEEVVAGSPVLLAESEETTHYSIIDTEGNAVSVTTTLNGGYGSKVVVAGSGFLLNNEMDDFSIKPGVPNDYGLIGGEANAIEPGKRMLSSMTPTIVEKEGKLFMVVGSPGGVYYHHFGASEYYQCCGL